ncbi:MAG: TIGR03986 family CRISPR-associated RAMP protein [Bacteroidales bacterium]|nr:TIGR03986 family CRISPR-associated RAMP protein [Bacteroidales bacterium]
MIMKAPYNFVPLADNVYFPAWVGDISHDVPFADGVSGEIEITLKAKTPVFVRNGHTKKEGEKKEGDYCKASVLPNGRYYLPGTSVKGAVRNILEIITFGKMRVDERAQFAQRDWENKLLYPLRDIKEQNKICGGWLCRKGEDYVIRECEKIYRIALKRVDDWLKRETGTEEEVMCDEFSKNSRKDLNKERELDGKKYDPKTARYKYALLESRGIGRERLRGLKFRSDEEFKKQEKGVKVAADGPITGTIVFTGQPDKAAWEGRRVGSGKFYDFVFVDYENREVNHPLTNSKFKNYEFIYAESEDWAEWKKELDGDGIPVFFRKKEGGEIKDFGLAQMYRLPYEKTPYEIERARYEKEAGALDMADCIFGYVDGQKALRGRVQFSHFISEDATMDEPKTLILNGPKASYYPCYIEQKGKGGKVANYKTYNDGLLAGWKKYVLRDGTWEKKMNNEKLDTEIFPLKAGASFKGRVVFHNLKHEELGALLSALSFHGNTDKCYLQVGQGKPYGYGKMSVSVDALRAVRNDDDTLVDSDSAMGSFELMMDKWLNSSWRKTRSVRELFALASNSVGKEDERFKYMSLDVDGKNNEFTDAKKGNEYLMRFSELQKPALDDIDSKISGELQTEIQKREEMAELSDKANEVRGYINSNEFTKAESAIAEMEEIVRGFKALENDPSTNPECVALRKAKEEKYLEVQVNDIQQYIDTERVSDAKDSLRRLKEVTFLYVSDRASEIVASLEMKIKGKIASEALVFNSLKFNTVQNNVAKWLEAKGKGQEFDAEDMRAVVEALRKRYMEENSKNKKDFEKKEKPKYAKWLGEANADLIAKE